MARTAVSARRIRTATTRATTRSGHWQAPTSSPPLVRTTPCRQTRPRDHSSTFSLTTSTARGWREADLRKRTWWGSGRPCSGPSCVAAELSPLAVPRVEFVEPGAGCLAYELRAPPQARFVARPVGRQRDVKRGRAEVAKHQSEGPGRVHQRGVAPVDHPGDVERPRGWQEQLDSFKDFVALRARRRTRRRSTSQRTRSGSSAFTPTGAR